MTRLFPLFLFSILALALSFLLLPLDFLLLAFLLLVLPLSSLDFPLLAFLLLVFLPLDLLPLGFLLPILVLPLLLFLQDFFTLLVFFFFGCAFRLFVFLTQVFIFLKQEQKRCALLLNKDNFIEKNIVSLPKISLKKSQKEVDKINKKKL